MIALFLFVMALYIYGCRAVGYWGFTIVHWLCRLIYSRFRKPVAYSPPDEEPPDLR